MIIETLYQLYKEHTNISTDSRNIVADSLFFALKGERFNGNQFAEQALKDGAAYAIIDEPSYQKNKEQYLLVPNVIKTLQALARYHRQQFSIPVIAVAGSNGKTTTKELITTVLSTT